MSQRARSPGIDEIQQQELARLFGSFARVRALLVPVAFAMLGYIAWTDTANWRRAIMAGVVCAAIGLALTELWHFQRSGMRRVRFVRTFVIAAIGHLAMCAASGGIESPFLPMLIPISLFFGAFVRERRARLLLLGLQLFAVWGMALCALRGWVPDLVPATFGGGSRAGHSDRLILFETITVSLFTATVSVFAQRVRKGFDTLVDRAAAARDEALRAHAEQAQLLTALSGEIAHELKNPLASVKGLATLLQGDQSGKNVERVGVLRREVDRMQAILDEFLNFSRPLGPLARQPEDLVALCEAVAALHEGVCRDVGLSVRVSAPGPVKVPCDGRKVKQIVINLLQNAIEASAQGGEVELRLSAHADVARLELLDRGAGLSPEVAARLFVAGATTKPKGSGLGLTIARALARQHGGECVLEARPDGGCCAAVTLPMGAA
jgi:signal transduction histidine kinase